MDITFCQDLNNVLNSFAAFETIASSYFKRDKGQLIVEAANWWNLLHSSDRRIIKQKLMWQNRNVFLLEFVSSSLKKDLLKNLSSSWPVASSGEHFLSSKPASGDWNGFENDIFVCDKQPKNC